MKSVCWLVSAAWLVVEGVRPGHYTGAVLEYRPLDSHQVQTAREVTITSSTLTLITIFQHQGAGIEH